MAVGKIPNLYQLSGDGLHITYATDGIRGDPSFSYQDRSQPRTFMGADHIKSEETGIGTLVTVVLHVTPDSGDTTFSLLVPKIALGEPDSVAVATVGITTMHRISLIGPPLGQDELYETTQLAGTASFVLF